MARSASKRTATDCTRPAESPEVIFFHKRGDNLYPTMRSKMRRACWASTKFKSILRAWEKDSLIAAGVIS